MGFLKPDARYGAGDGRRLMTARTVATVIVHDAADARRAVNAAISADVDVNLLSAPGAARTLGPAVFLEMIACALPQNEAPDVRAILDCGNVPGDALRALRQGCRCIRVDMPEGVSMKLQDIATQLNATVIDRPIDALDLGDAAYLDEDIINWITQSDRPHA